jgi:hypothetical protein
VALKALEAAEGPAFASAVIPLVVQGYSGRVAVQVYDRWGSLLAERELEVEDGIPFQIRVALPRGLAVVRVKVLDASGNPLLDQDVSVIPAPSAARAASWVGGAQVVGGWEVVGGLPVSPVAAMPPDYAKLLEEYQKLKSLVDQAGGPEQLQQLLAQLQQLEQQAQQHQDLLAKLQDLESKVNQILQQAAQ